MASSLRSGVFFLLAPVLVCLFSLYYSSQTWLSFFPEASKKTLVIDRRRQISYQGSLLRDVEHFYNIFYAHDTSGSNRFAPPMPYDPPSGALIDATTPGAWCPQGMGDPPLPFTSPITNVSENCLSLRIARPKGTKASAKLPVMVWIHGGGSALGSATDKLYQPDGLIRQSVASRKPVILVGMNYRLGIFGYATNKALRDAKSANVGLRDQRAAFNWIQSNIEAFGGDPNRVTGVGQSVGASSIGLHLTSFRGEFGVPMMSGATGLNFNVKSDLVANNTRTVAETLRCIRGEFDSEWTINCLRDTPLEKLMNVSVSLSRRLRPPFGELSFYPSFDDYYIPDRPSVLLKKGQFVKNIPILASWSANDGAWYPPPSTHGDASILASFSTFITNFTQPSLSRSLSLYPRDPFSHLSAPSSPVSVDYYRAAQINRDMWFTCPVIDFTWNFHKHGQTNVRLYEMNQTRFAPVFEFMGVPFWKVAHLSDIPYLLNTEVVGGGGDNSQQQLDLSARLSSSAIAFAYDGDPDQGMSAGEGLRPWPLAYGRSSTEGLKRDHPDALTVKVVGGPHGTGSATVFEGPRQDEDGLQKALEWEMLLQRCEFINSIHEELGV